MNAYRQADEDEDDWDDERPDYGDESEEEPTIPCPYCRREILEDSPFCPHCERYISEEDHAGPRKPLWVFLTALVCLGIAIWWLFMAF
jgi:hypothetical protein